MLLPPPLLALRQTSSHHRQLQRARSAALLACVQEQVHEFATNATPCKWDRRRKLASRETAAASATAATATATATRTRIISSVSINEVRPTQDTLQENVPTAQRRLQQRCRQSRILAKQRCILVEAAAETVPIRRFVDS